MNKYNFTKSDYYTIRACELNKIIEKVYNVTSFNCSLGASSNLSTTHEINETTKMYHDQECVNDVIKEGCCEFDMVSLILLDLLIKKEIPEGDYIVDHSW